MEQALTEAETKISAYQETLDAIHNCMDGKEWDADTLDQISDLLRQVGYEIRDPDPAIAALETL
jgi:hypothetical protein